MRYLVVAGLLALSAAPTASAVQPFRTINTAGVSLRVPAGWHAVVAEGSACDPARLIVVSSARLHIGSDGQLAAPANGRVLIVLLEDRLHQDRPSGNLRRPTRFSVSWNRLMRVKPDCGLPDTPASMRYFKAGRRYIGFIVYPGAQTRPNTRATTLAIMDSLRVRG